MVALSYLPWYSALLLQLQIWAVAPKKRTHGIINDLALEVNPMSADPRIRAATASPKRPKDAGSAVTDTFTSSTI